MFGLQVEQLFREANSPERRAFRGVEAQLVFLAEVLSVRELQRARAFLHESLAAS